MKTLLNTMVGIVTGLMLIICGAVLLIINTLLPYIGFAVIIIFLIGVYLYDQISKEG